MGRAILFLIVGLIAAPIWLFKRLFSGSVIKPDFGEVIEEVMEPFAILFQSLDERWEYAKTNAEERDQGGSFADLDKNFSIFLAFVGASTSQIGGYAALASEELKRRYLYFVLGAAHCLVENSPNEEKAGKFFRAVAGETSAKLFGKSQGEKEVVIFLENSASEKPTQDYFTDVSKNGYAAMKNYLHGIEGFQPDTVARIIRQMFQDSVLGSDASTKHGGVET